MSIDISQISLNIFKMRNQLFNDGDIITHRHILILAGDGVWQKEALRELLQGYESESLWLSEHPVENIPFVETKKAHSWLGKEKRVVVFDANENFNPDSFAAISGIVTGGGLFILLLPEKEKWNEVYTSYFEQRLIHSINSHSKLTVITPNTKDNQIVFSDLEIENTINCDPPYLTFDQKSAVEEIKKQILNNSMVPIVLMSDRGRGKSAALGIAIAEIVKDKKLNVVITAPRMRATDILFKHLEKNLLEPIVTRGCVKYKESTVQFYSPDELIGNAINADVLLVDEAAAIPLPLLSVLLNQYQQCVFATTIHGYEGTGRGFTLKFFNELEVYNSKWLKLEMKSPIRWADNDPLENWVFDLLCLDAELVDIKLLSGIDNIEFKLLEKRELFDNQKLLSEVFSLLVLAHYRTRPKDLKSLLDDEKLFLYVALKNEHVIAVSLVVEEGCFSSELSTSVYRGERRPQGHLLAQTLTFHCGIEDAATLNYARIMRIAVHPSLQQQGIGSALLNFIIENERNLNRDAIGASFGMTAQLLSFWEKLNFNVVRIGFTREKTSGEHAAVVLLGLSDKGLKVYKQSRTRFNEQISYWMLDILRDIPSEIKLHFNNKAVVISTLSDSDKKDIRSFIHFSRNYELCISAINKLVVLAEKEINSKIFSEKFRVVLNEKVLNKKSWKEIREIMDLSGQKEARNLFRSAILELLPFL